MKLWYTIFIATFIIIYGTLSVALLGGWVVERFRKGLSAFLLAFLIGVVGSASPLHADALRSMVNLRGDQVLVPSEVPPKESFVLQRLMSVDERLIVFLYHDPKFRGPVDYAETYNLIGELLQVAWYEPDGGLRIARDINLGSPSATRAARILKIIDLREHGFSPDARPDIPTGDRRPVLQVK
jgi:hypothetical protein